MQEFSLLLRLKKNYRTLATLASVIVICGWQQNLETAGMYIK